jgi:hypothetical protein
MARPLKKITEQNLNRIQQKVKKLDLEIDEISTEAGNLCERIRTVSEDGDMFKSIDEQVKYTIWFHEETIDYIKELYEELNQLRMFSSIAHTQRNILLHKIKNVTLKP